MLYPKVEEGQKKLQTQVHVRKVEKLSIDLVLLMALETILMWMKISQSFEKKRETVDVRPAV